MNIFIKLPPPATAFILLLLAYLAANAYAPLQPILFMSQPISVILFLISCTFMFWAIILFRIHRTTPNPHGKPEHLVKSGPYKLTRNPMYLGLLILLLSYAFWRGQLIFLAPPVLFFIVMDRIVIPNEEKTASEALGEEYNSYSKSVSRWL